MTPPTTHHRGTGAGDGGAFAALELVILFPFVIVLLLLVVAFGRVARGRDLVDQAAQASSRAASLTTSPGAARTAATQAAHRALAHGGLSCAEVDISVDTTRFTPGGQVTTTVTCTADLSALTLSGAPGHLSVTAHSTSQLEPYRQLTATDTP